MDDAPAIDPDVPFEHIELDGGSWIDIARGWLRNPDALYASLDQSVRWQQGKVWRYEKYIDEPGSAPGS